MIDVSPVKVEEKVSREALTIESPRSTANDNFHSCSTISNSGRVMTLEGPPIVVVVVNATSPSSPRMKSPILRCHAAVHTASCARPSSADPLVVFVSALRATGAYLSAAYVAVWLTVSIPGGWAVTAARIAAATSSRGVSVKAKSTRLESAARTSLVRCRHEGMKALEMDTEVTGSMLMWDGRASWKSGPWTRTFHADSCRLSCLQPLATVLRWTRVSSSAMCTRKGRVASCLCRRRSSYEGRFGSSPSSSSSSFSSPPRSPASRALFSRPMVLLLLCLWGLAVTSLHDRPELLVRVVKVVFCC